MFRKRLAIFLSLAMFTTSIPMPPINVLAAEEVVEACKEDDTFDSVSVNGEKSKQVSEEKEDSSVSEEDESAEKASDSAETDEEASEKTVEKETADKNLEDTGLPDHEVEFETVTSNKANGLSMDEEDNPFPAWETLPISFDNLTEDGHLIIFTDEERTITLQSAIFDHEDAQGRDLQIKWSLYKVNHGDEEESREKICDLGNEREITLNGKNLIQLVNPAEKNLYIQAQIFYEDILLADGRFTIDPRVPISLDGITEDGFVYIFKDEIRDISVVSDIFYKYNDVQVRWELSAIDRQTGEFSYNLFEHWKDGSQTDYPLEGAQVENYTDWNDTILRMRVVVYQGDYEFGSKEFTIDYYEKESYYSEDTQEVTLIPGGEKLIHGEINGYIRDQYHPSGDSVYCKVTDVTLTNSDDSTFSDVCSVYKENNDFRIVAEHFGSAEARVTYYDYYGEERSYHFTIHVDPDVLYLDIKYPSNTDCMIPHETRDITTSLRHEWYKPDGEQGLEIIDDYKINLATDEDGNPAYNQELIDVNILEDGKTLQIGSKERLGESDIFLNTEVQIDNGNETVPVSISEKVHVNIVDRYFYSEDFDYNTDIKIGENTNICPTIKSVRRENGEVITEDFNGTFCFDMDYNQDELAVTEIEGGIAITRKVDCKTRMFIRCFAKSEDNVFNVFEKWVNFNEVEHEWIITYEWSTDLSKCDAKANCKYDNEVRSESVLSDKRVKDPASCNTDEIISYSASFKNALFTTQTQEGNGQKALGHEYVHNKCIRCSAYEALEAPTLKKVENGINGVKFTWNSVQNAEKYNIYRKFGTGQWVKIGTSTTTAYTDTKAALGKKYSYSVCCVANDGSNQEISSYDNTGLAITRLATITPSLKNSRKAITIKWKKVAAAKGYVIYRKVGSGNFKKLATIKKAGTVSYSDKKVKKGKTYTYYVYAYTGNVTSAYVKKSLKKKK